jgi:hypothetical protein
MTWYSNLNNKKPKDKQEVVISFGGVYRLATYDSDRKVFCLKSQPYVEFKINELDIYWSEFSVN